MRQPSDETLIAYLDGELDIAAREEVAAAMDREPQLRERASALTDSAAVLRAAMDEVLREDVPQRLIDAARGSTERSVIDLMAERARRISVANLTQQWGTRRFWVGAAVAASLCLFVGAGGGYFAAHGPADTGTTVASAQTPSYWLDNIAGYHRLLINAGVNEQSLVDVPPNGDQSRKNIQKLPAGFRTPNLKTWGLTFDGARYLIVEGQPATQLFYVSQDKKLGSITMVVGATGKSDTPIVSERRDDMNFVYWRHAGHAYALVGTADVNALRSIAKDIVSQLNAAT
jgi:anti-sigma factor RsiW